jgi:hypothetical protein
VTNDVFDELRDRILNVDPADTPASADTTLPGTGRVVLRFLTYGGRRALEATDDEFVAGRHPLAPVFEAADDVLTQLRLIEEARG